MSDWSEKRLGEMIAVNPPVKLVKGVVYPFIDIDKVDKQSKIVSNVEERLFDGQGGSRFQAGDTVFSRITPCLENRKIAQVNLNGAVTGFGSTEFFVFRNKEGLTDSKFVYYFISSDWVVLPAINSMTGASGRQRADRGFVEKLKLKFPDLPTQTRIADILAAYDDAIENNNRRIALLEKAARELYHEWFIRMRFPGHENVKMVNGLPEGWEAVRFGTLVEIIDGDRGVNYPKQDEFFNEGYCLFLNAGNVTKSGFNFENNAFITENKDGLLRKGKLVRNDIILTTRGTVGNVAYYSKHIPYGVMRINSGMVILRDSGEVSPEFLYIMLRNDAIQKMIDLFSSGSAQPQLPIKDMRKLKIIKPTEEILLRFTEITREMLDQAALLQTQSQNLARQRDLLLPRLMSGKMEVIN